MTKRLDDVRFAEVEGQALHPWQWCHDLHFFERQFDPRFADSVFCALFGATYTQYITRRWELRARLRLSAIWQSFQDDHHPNLDCNSTRRSITNPCHRVDRPCTSHPKSSYCHCFPLLSMSFNQNCRQQIRQLHLWISCYSYYLQDWVPFTSI